MQVEGPTATTADAPGVVALDYAYEVQLDRNFHLVEASPLLPGELAKRPGDPRAGATTVRRASAGTRNAFRILKP